jgi:cytochrome o ubiquinol oxidase operon protein cyoD
MSHEQPATRPLPANPDHATLRAYVSGYILSIGLTLSAYLMVTHQTASYDWLVAAISGLALLQFLVQMVFFLHLRAETRPRWKLFVLLFMTLVVLILVFGTLWIMNNLNYRMTPQQINTYMQNQDNL